MNTTKNIFIIILTAISLLNIPANADVNEGMIRIKSNNNVSTTINKLEAALIKKGMTIFKRIDHAAGAKKSGFTLRPTELLIFGNPKVGTPLMLCSQTAALDLPQKALAYKDKNGQVWLTYNNPVYLASRHSIRGCDTAIQKISNALTHFSKTATE